MKRVFITGITGTLGTALALKHREMGDSISGCARNENKISEWMNQNKWGQNTTDGWVGPFDAHNLNFWAHKPEVLYHCAALKHVEVCEANPAEATRQNADLVTRLARICQEKGIHGVFLSSDKAVTPGSGVYGATKLLAERIALSHKQTVVRLGNLLGSSGSVFIKWKQAVQNNEPIILTDRRCTRFFITVKEAVEFTISMGRLLSNNDVKFPHMMAVNMGELADAISGGKVLEQTGLRPGETLHQYIVPPVERLGNLMDPEWACSASAQRWPITKLLSEAGAI